MNPKVDPPAEIAAAVPPGSVLVTSAQEIDRALDIMAGEISADLAALRPVTVTIMNGGLVFAGQLLTRLPFALDCDYIHVRRYGRLTHGGELEWIAGPHVDLRGRTVLLLDDILDEGRTLAVVKEALLARGAADVRIAAFARKDRGEPPAIEADYVGVTVPNLFVFGFGMDVDGAFRNLPAIYALPPEVSAS
ncbi:MAG: hypoxanthine-guanine phosphoribosyltransferase [Burkholderiaceae bacterium]|jgi:hypoxanthine phosphoribosyltransferase|nr:hypoxanthine-guanine phosphoribosyltransferase [Burkholderiaceae bacterium]